MISASKINKTLVSGLVGAIIAAFAATAPAQAQWTPVHQGWSGHWGGFYRPHVHRLHPVARPVMLVSHRRVERPFVRRVVIIERPVVRRPVFVERTVVVRRPGYVRRVVARPVSWREVRFVERPWPGRRWHDHHRRCFLPERYLCR